MFRTLTIKIDKSSELLDTVRTFNIVCNKIIDYAFENEDLNKNRIHAGTYIEIREEYSEFPSGLIQTSRDVAVECLKKNLRKNIKPKKKEFSSIRYDNRTMKVFLKSGYCSLSTINGRKKYSFKIPDEGTKYFDKYMEYSNWNVQNAQLKIGKNACYLKIQLEKTSPEFNHGTKRLGIDRGINNIAVCSDNSFYNSKQLKKRKGEYQYLKARLQSKGTHSAKRHLKKLAGRERRFVKDVNHNLANDIVNKPFDIFVFEDLTNIRAKNKNSKLGSWSFNELQQFVEYKAENIGKKVEYINPAYTSQTCSKCGYKSKNNRLGKHFECKSCGFKLDADLNAARNITIFGTSSDGRLSVNQPIVTFEKIVTSSDALAQSN